jgi:Domain of unknown function (DUF1707)
MDRDPGPPERASLRASDADRERLVEALREHHVDGRLTAEELEERTEQAYAARTLGELDALTIDLPPVATLAPAGRPVAATPATPSPSPRMERARASLVRQALGSLVLILMMVGIWALSGAGYFWPGWFIFVSVAGLAWRTLSVFGPRSDSDRSRRRDRDRSHRDDR